MRIGVISDTHGLLRPAALDALRGCAHLLHAGDIGGPEVLEALSRVAPVTAVRGNNDRAAWAAHLPDVARVELGGTRILVIHDVSELAVDLAAEGIGVVVSGHSHRPSVSRRGDVLFLNPGSAGPRRFTLPIAVAQLHVGAGRAPAAELVELVA
jgi:putative phosphoesterase